MKFLVATCVLAALACSTRVQANFLVNTFQTNVDSYINQTISTLKVAIDNLHSTLETDGNLIIGITEGAYSSHREDLDKNLELNRKMLAQLKEEKAANPKLEACEAMGVKLNGVLIKLTKHLALVHAERMTKVAKYAKPMIEKADNLMVSLEKYLQQTDECTKATNETIFSRVSCLTRIKVAAKWEILTQVTPLLVSSLNFAARASFPVAGYLATSQDLENSIKSAERDMHKINECLKQAKLNPAVEN